MKVQSVRDYKKPDYPPEELFVYNPELLRENMPLIWKGKALVAGALIAFTMGGCQKNIPPQTGKQAVVVLNENFAETLAENKTTNKQELKQENQGKVAPLFNHGDGRGSSGCFAVTPSVFVNETDARKIIQEELAKNGIIIDKNDIGLEGEGSEIPILVVPFDLSKRNYENSKNIFYHLSFDGYSTSSDIGYVFVSTIDTHYLVKELFKTTTHSIDTIKSAEHLREGFEKYGKKNVVVFYAPDGECKEIEHNENQSFEQYSKRMDLAEKEAYEKSKELLRLQVRDFIEWAKKNGLIKN